jgi:hypothetical protein
MKNIEFFDIDINEYIRQYIEVKYFKKISLISKKFYVYYSLDKYLKVNTLSKIYFSYGNTIPLIIQYINYEVINTYKYNTNSKLIKNLNRHLSMPYLKDLAIDNKLYFLNFIIESQYHCINNKYKNILNLFEKIKDPIYYNLNVNEFVSVTSLIINYINAPYELNFYQYSNKKITLCKLILAIILFNIITYANYNSKYNNKLNILLDIQYIKIDEFKDVLNYYQYDYPIYFVKYINNSLDNYKNYKIST